MLRKTASILFFSILFAFTPSNQDDLSECVKKVDSSWGEACKSCTYNKNIYKVYYVNTCDIALDVLISLQGAQKIWKTDYFENVQPNDTMFAFNCQGTGKILKWVRVAGDNELVFPTTAEINDAY
jgi:hypothetical protein